jgi:hypothetical protein
MRIDLSGEYRRSAISLYDPDRRRTLQRQVVTWCGDDHDDLLKSSPRSGWRRGRRGGDMLELGRPISLRIASTKLGLECCDPLVDPCNNAAYYPTTRSDRLWGFARMQDARSVIALEPTDRRIIRLHRDYQSVHSRDKACRNTQS